METLNKHYNNKHHTIFSFFCRSVGDPSRISRDPLARSLGNIHTRHSCVSCKNETPEISLMSLSHTFHAARRKKEKYNQLKIVETRWGSKVRPESCVSTDGSEGERF